MPFLPAVKARETAVPLLRYEAQAQPVGPPGPPGGGDLYPRRLARLAHRGREQVAVLGILTPTGKRNLPRPRIAGALGPLDQQDLGACGTVDQHQGNGRGTRAGRCGRLGLMTRERPPHGGQRDQTTCSVRHCTAAAAPGTVRPVEPAPAATRVSPTDRPPPRSTSP